MAVPVRYRLVGLLTVGAMINFIDRVNISVAAPVIMGALGWDEARFGVIFSAFLAGYTLFQFPGGLIADRWDAKKVVALSCLGFSLFTALTPLGGLAFALMLALRFLVGAFESVSFPAYASINSRWIPRHEYSRAQTVSLSGSFLGQTFAYPLTTWIVLTFTWPVVFYFNALLGVLWVIAWAFFATNTPAEHPRISREELQHIEENRAARTGGVSVSPWALLKSPQVLLLSLSYMCLVYGVWMIVLWLPTYLVKGRGFTVQEMGWIGMIPTLASFVGLVGGGVLSDRLLRRGFSTRFARARGPAICIAVGVPFLALAVLVPWGWVSVACLAAYLLTINLSTGGYWSVPLEYNPRLVGAISGVMTCAGNLGGVFGPMSAGYIFSATGNWALPFLVAAGFALAAFLIYYFLVVPQPLALEESADAPAMVEPIATEAGAHES
ncbi:MAG TPA: MFS transporter [Blastocatellia bacterium]|nr:MFS transporter [Blastocatellia bacterium]